jgi:uncharacterized radical SAM superfamily protein
VRVNPTLYRSASEQLVAPNTLQAKMSTGLLRLRLLLPRVQHEAATVDPFANEATIKPLTEVRKRLGDSAGCGQPNGRARVDAGKQMSAALTTRLYIF